MSWQILVAAAVILDSLRIFIDNYTSDTFFNGRDAVGQKWFYGFAYIAVGIVILFITGFNFSETNFMLTTLFIFSGFLSSIAGIPYFKALEIENSTNLGIFIQVAPIFYLLLGWLFLGESFAPIQLAALAIILVAPILIIITTKKRSRKNKLRAIFYTILYVLIAVIANLIFAKSDNAEFGIINEMAWLFIGKGFGNVITLLIKPTWRKRFYHVLKSSKRKVLWPLSVNTLVGFGKDFTYRAALITAPTVAVASAASDSIEPIVIFFMGIILTLIWPKFGREKLNRKTVLVHLIATVLVVIGIVLLQLPNM